MKSRRTARGLGRAAGHRCAGGAPTPPSDAAKHGEGEDLATAREAVNAAERLQLESLMEDLKKAIDKSQALQPFKDQLLLLLMLARLEASQHQLSTLYGQTSILMHGCSLSR